MFVWVHLFIFSRGTNLDISHWLFMIRNKYIALFIGSKIVPKCGGLRVNTFSCHRKSQKDLCCRGKETDLGWEIEQGLQFKVKFTFSFFKLPYLLPKWWIALAFSCQRCLYWEQNCQAKICKILPIGGYHSITLSCSSSFAIGTTCKFCSIAVPLFYCGHTALLSGGIYMESRGKCYDFLFSLPFSSQMLLSGGT